MVLTIRLGPWLHDLNYSADILALRGPGSLGSGPRQHTLEWPPEFRDSQFIPLFGSSSFCAEVNLSWLSLSMLLEESPAVRHLMILVAHDISFATPLAHDMADTSMPTACSLERARS